MDDIQIGDRIRVVLDELFIEDGVPTITYKFAPVRWEEKR
jgi:hypothetical protein